jgi:hypothetical protein
MQSRHACPCEMVHPGADFTGSRGTPHGPGAACPELAGISASCLGSSVPAGLLVRALPI